MTDQEKEELEQRIITFLDKSERTWLSTATMQYALYAHEGKMQTLVSKFVDKVSPDSEEDKKMTAEIEKISNPEDIDRWMRSRLSYNSREALYQKMLEYEDQTAEIVKKRIMRSDRGEFIENAQAFFMKSKTNYSDWIVENLEKMKSPYARSTMCLVVGFRGKLEDIELMMKESNYLKVNYKDENYWEGPVYAVDELYHRFLHPADNKDKRKKRRKRK